MKQLRDWIIVILALVSIALLALYIRSQLTYMPPTDFNPDKPPVKSLP